MLSEEIIVYEGITYHLVPNAEEVSEQNLSLEKQDEVTDAFEQ